MHTNTPMEAGDTTPTRYFTHTHTQVAQLPADQQVDVRLFAAICCLAERMHNLYYL